MATDSVTYSTVPWLQSSTETASTAKTSTSSAGYLGKDAFLKLLITELQHQDPTEPMKDRDFISQMASFSSLEQMQNLSKGFETINTTISNSLIPSLLVQQASNLIGQSVTYPGTDKDGKAVTLSGTVSKIVVEDGKPYCVVNGKNVDPSVIKEIGMVSNNQIDALLEKLDNLMTILVPEEGAASGS